MKQKQAKKRLAVKTACDAMRRIKSNNSKLGRTIERALKNFERDHRPPPGRT